MKYLSFLIAVLLFTHANPAVAQNSMKGQNGPGERKYNTETVTSVKGTIKEIRRIPHGWGGNTGIHLMVAAHNEIIPVHLGPEWYLKDKITELKEGDAVEIEGSKIVFDNKPAIVAKSVKTASVHIRLRKDDGTPLWSQKQRGNR